MAFKIISNSPNDESFNYVAKNSQQYKNGALVVRDTTNSYVIPATASLADATVIEAIYTGTTGTTAATGTVFIKCTVLKEGMLLEADCTNNSSYDQLMKAHLLTDSITVNNSSTHSTDKDAVFIALAQKGADADKKLIGRIVKLGQVLA